MRTQCHKTAKEIFLSASIQWATSVDNMPNILGEIRMQSRVKAGVLKLDICNLNARIDVANLQL